MQRIARQLLAAAHMTADVELVYEHAEWSDQESLAIIHERIAQFVDQIRRNESVDVFVSRHDTNGEMRIGIWVGNHDAHDAIINAVEDRARKMARTV